ncbi:MAG TPA: NAD(P)/FAD-dependent oxidoreductase [Devosia sp.]|jgi:NADH dehydrogenase|uniref:NAD(P)/FAD-dependent oxidoreductase n=1 Tax=Devosia sp. TaxID=1871048 RepID=UPI002F9441C0
MKVVIVGGGFAGLACAQGLGGSEHQVLVIDRRNYHLFQPLLYQVATGALSPADIAEPIRKLLKRHRNISVIMGDVAGVETTERQVVMDDGARYPFDVLILATGSQYAYFGNDQWAEFAPGLKTIDNARVHRSRLLSAFEKAERSNNAEERAKLTTTVVIGGGPTGVEMAGAIAELGRWTLAGEFRNVDPSTSRVILVEGSPSILGQFPEDLVRYSRKALGDLGVEIRTQTRVLGINSDGVQTSEGFIAAGTVVWGAGVTATPAAKWLGIETDRSNRIPVDQTLMVKGLEGVYALGDIALFMQDGVPLPGLAQVAKQQGEYLGHFLREQPSTRRAEPFRFKNKGNTAVIGRHAAIFDFGHFHLKGRVAWFLWAIVHVYLLVSFEKRALVSLQWLWRYITKARGVRIIR